MSIQTILVATDFSDQSDIALAQATAIAQREGRKLVILHVDGSATQPTSEVVTGRAADTLEEMRERHRQKELARLEDRAAVVRKRGVEVETRTASGHADDAIVAVADEVGADLLVTGTKGRTGLSRLLLGSVAEKVVRTARTNVLVARGTSPDIDVEAPFRRILVPTDFSAASEKALELALGLAADDASIELFHAWQYPAGTHGLSTPDVKEGPMADLRRDILEANLQLAQRWVERHSQGSLTVSFLQDFGSASELILDRLTRDPHDLVAMGTHGYRGFRRFLLGSVAEATVRHAPCSVLVAHAEDAGR